MKQEEQQTPWYTNPYVWLMIGLPLSAVIAGTYTIYLAVISDDGLVSEHYYKDGLIINRVLKLENRASELNLSAMVNFDDDANKLKILLTAKPEFIYPKEIKASFLNKTRKGFDKEVNLVLGNENVYAGKLPELVRGQWYVEIETTEWRILQSIDN